MPDDFDQDEVIRVVLPRNKLPDETADEWRAEWKAANEDAWNWTRTRNAFRGANAKTQVIGYKPPYLLEETTEFREKTGIALPIPRDGRIRLSFDLPWHWEYEAHMMSLDTEKGLTPEDKGKLRKALESKMEKIETFHKKLCESGDFYVLDINPTKQDTELATYRPRPVSDLEDSDRVESETPECSTNQWERVIFCQGLSSVLAANDLARGKVFPVSYLPYLIDGTYDNPIDKMIKLHLDCSRRVGSKLANPYRDVDNGFHITFYEKVELLSDNESWKTGHLYEKAGDPKGMQQKFRQSAFTMLATGEDLKMVPESEQRSKSDDKARYWTMLLLSPSGFFEKPLEIPEWKKEWKKVGSLPNKLSAEVACIVYALKGVVNRWTELNEYISELLMENFMDPKVYDGLLLDDKTFSRSKRYFWVIGCLNEFVESISDNIKQWELFRQARVIPFLPALRDTNPGTNPGTILGEELQQFQDLYKEADNLFEALEDLRSQFRFKLTTVRTLRDGLASLSSLAANQASKDANESSLKQAYLQADLTTKMGNLTEALAKDSSNMKIIAILTALFLPGTFMAVLLTTPMFKWPDPPDGQIVVRLPFEIYWAVSGSVTLTLGFGMLFWFWMAERRKKSGPKTESGPRD